MRILITDTACIKSIFLKRILYFRRLEGRIRNVISSHASCRRPLHLLSAVADHKRRIDGVRREGRRTRMVITMARCVVHRLSVPIGLWSVAFGRLLHLRESRLSSLFFCHLFIVE